MTEMNAEKVEFVPKIVGFLCKWCAGSAFDVGGTSGVDYPANVRIIKVVCSGSVDPTYVLRALQEGADGVLVVGCPRGNCHFVSGNEKVQRRAELLSTILEPLGVDRKRVRVEWIGSDEARKLAGVARELTAELQALGPNPIGQYASF